MAAIQSRTREQIRRSVAANLDQLPAGTATGNGSTTTLLDTTLLGGDDHYNGWWIVFTSGTNDGSIKRISDYTASTGTITWIGAVGASSATNDTYELWEPHYPPDRIHGFINDSIIERTPRASVIDEDISNHGHIRDSRYDVPSAMVGVSQVDYRYGFSKKQVEKASSSWTAGSSVTITADTEDHKANNSAIRMYLSSVSAATVGYKDITAIDLRKYDTLEFWFKSSVTHAAGDLTIVLGEGSALGTARETINIPAATARTWTYMRVDLANPELLSSIASVGLKFVTGTSTRYIWINDIKAVETESAVYNRLWSGAWRAEEETRKIFLTEAARKEVGYNLIRLVGMKKPDLLSSDSDTANMSPSLIIARATRNALISLARGNTTDPDDNDRRAAFFEGIAEQAEKALPVLRPGTKMVG